LVEPGRVNKVGQLHVNDVDSNDVAVFWRLAWVANLQSVDRNASVIEAPDLRLYEFGISEQLEKFVAGGNSPIPPALAGAAGEDLSEWQPISREFVISAGVSLI
jgi:hypothetical protein